MIRKTLILLSLALCVLGDGPHAISEQRIRIRHKEHRGHHGELSHIGSKKLEHHEEYAWSYPSYEFSYSVHDPHTHDKKGQQESRKGDEVKGEYWLIEPDGRKRTVTYHADKHSGFHAVVHYSDHHHHITEDHDHKNEDQKDDKESDESDGDDKKHHDENKGKDNNENENEDERNNEDEDEKKDEGDEKKEENNEGVEEGEGNEDEERGGEESRGREGGVVRWGYSPNWDRKGHGYDRDDKRDRDEGRRGNGRDGDDQRDGKGDRDEGRRGRGRDEDRDRDDDQYDIGKITVYEKLGPYGRRDAKKRDEKRKEEDRDREETLLWEERRKFDERRGYPSQLTPYFGHASRINPRFYRHNQQPSIAKRI